MTFLSTPGNSLIHKHFGQISYHLPGQINSSNNFVFPCHPQKSHKEVSSHIHAADIKDMYQKVTV